jgi:FkbM family methyltransferase
VTDFADERVLDVVHEIRGENPEYRVMQALLSPGATFVDVGANFGTFSLLASRLVGSTGRVIAIEPQERLSSFIEESIALSGVDNCEVHRAACGKSNGEASLLIPVDDSGRAGFFQGFSGRKQHTSATVPVTTLDFILRDIAAGSPCLIKIDVEGSEMDVLDGGAAFISSHHPGIMIEINPWSAAASGTTARQIVDRLVELGYSRFSSVESFPKELSLEKLPLERQFNLVAMPPSK